MVVIGLIAFHLGSPSFVFNTYDRFTVIKLDF